VIGAAILKEIQLLLRDRGGLASMFLLPVAFITVFGFMFRGSGGNRREQPTPLSEWHPSGNARLDAIVKEVEASGIFEIHGEASAAAVEAAVARKDAAAGLVLPADFGPGGAKAVVYADPAVPRVSGPVVGALQGLLARAQLAGGGGASGGFPALVDVRTPTGVRDPLEDVDSFQVSVPGNAVLFIFFLSTSVALSFVEERKSGAWRRLLAAPVRRPVLLLAKLVPFFLVGLAQMAFFFGVGIAVFGMRLGGSVVALAALTAAVVFCATALGLFVASLGGGEKQVHGFTTVAVLVMALLGGCMFPRLFMPPAMKTLGLFTPHAWALDGYYDVLIRDGTTLADVAMPVLVVFGYGLGLAVLGWLRFRFERT
jgi:ABC-type multidrug transport system permease subunit